MKKFISVIVAAVLVAAMIPAVVNADYTRPGNDGNIIVPYTSGGITIDGTLAQGEWSETNKIRLDETNLVGWVGESFTGPIDYYYSWGDAGLYMAAVVSDDIIEDGLSEGGLATRFQIALNPAGIICDMYAGLFFSLTPVADSDEVILYRHDYEMNNNQAYDASDEEGYEGKYTLIKDGEDVIGWNLECVIPWYMIASEDRYADLDEDDEIMLTNFNPKDENRARAFCTAQIAYVQCNNPDGGVFGTGRTCADGEAGVWTIDSYDIILLFALPGETNRSTETEYFTNTSSDGTTAAEDVTTEADETTEPENTTDADTETEPAVTTDGETKPDATTTEGEDSTPVTTDKPADTTPSGDKGGLPTGALIAIIAAAVVVVAGVVIAIVAGKKKK